MPAYRIINNLGRLFIACMAVAALLASEHHGIVRSNGMPVPGASVTAVKGDKKVATTTDENGMYSFPDLEDGVWTITVDMLGFGKNTKEVAVTPQAPSPEWDLKLMSAAAIKAAIAAAAAPAPAATPTAPAATASANAAPAQTPKTPATPAGAKPAATTAANNQRGNAQGGRGGNQSGRNGNPSLRQALQQGGTGFQRADVNTTGDASALPDNSNDNSFNAGGGDLSQNSGDALTINGSVSSGVGMPGQNDWFGGRGGMMGMGMDGMGGPGGFGGPGGDNAQLGQPGQGGPGGFGGGRGGGGGGGFAGGRGGGGGPMPGGFGGGRGGPGGRGGRGGPGGPGRGNFASFGNGRRNPRMRYNANVGFTLDNSALDAKNYSITGQDTPKPAFAKSRLTSTFGGPLKIPHLLSGEHTTFNINYSLGRTRNGQTYVGTMPTAAERAGDFSQAFDLNGKPVTILDPLSGAPFAGNMIPSNRISSQAAGLLQFYPLPNLDNPNSRYNYQTSWASVSNQDNLNTRISETINWRNQISGGLGYQRASGITPSVFNFTDTSHQSAMNANVTYSYHFTQRIINRLNFTFSRNTQQSNGFFTNVRNVSGELGITGNDQDPNFWGPPSLSFQQGGFASLSDASKSLNRAQTSALGESVIWIHGSHNFTFGGDFRRVQTNPLSQSNARGGFVFTGANTGFDFSDFLLGTPDTSSIAFGNADKYFRASWFDAYVTDDWRLSTKLSLNIGFRWDYQAPVTEKYGRLVNLDVGQFWTNPVTVCGVAIAGCTPSSSAGLSSALVHADPHEFEPRVGFAYRPFTKGSMVIRGGLGLYYNTSVYQSIAQQMSQQYPLSYTVQDSSSFGPLTLANGFPIQTLNPISTFAIDPNFRIGYSEIWQIAVQNNLPRAFFATITYNGTKGTHQPQEFIPWSTPPNAPKSIYPSNYYYQTSGGNSIYQGVSGMLQRRFRSGLSGSANYTFSRALDDASAGGRGGSSLIAQDWLDLDAERARSSGVREHTLSMNMQYSTGMGARGGALVSGVKGALLKDWTVTTNISMGSGAPLTPNIQSLRLGGTAITGPVRPFYTGEPLYFDNGLLNPFAFTNPLPGQFGNAGRNILNGPASFSINASAGRIFRLGERRSADLRFESTNPINHVIYNGINTTVGNVQYGLPTSAAPMRSMSANLRFRF